MIDYEKLVLDARKKTSKLTLDEQRKITKIFEDAIENLAKKAGKARGGITKAWALEYAMAIQEVKTELEQSLQDGLESALIEVSENAISVDLEIFREGLSVNQALAESVTNMFARVPKEVIESIVSGRLYKDGKGLDRRIWQVSNGFGKDIDYIILRALAEKKSAIELAKDLEWFVNAPERRWTTWGDSYPNFRNKIVDYNAMRLARTTINHVHQMTTIKGANKNPYIEGIRWRSALIHGRTCSLCRERHGTVYPKDNVPLDHPNGLCTMLPEIPMSLNDVADELREWAKGGSNPKLDRWYKEWGNEFI